MDSARPYIPLVLPHLDALAEDHTDRVLERVGRELELVRRLSALGADAEVLLPVIRDEERHSLFQGVSIRSFRVNALTRKVGTSRSMAKYCLSRRPALFAFKGFGYTLTSQVYFSLEGRPPLVGIVAGGKTDALASSLDLALVEDQAQAAHFAASHVSSRVFDKYVSVPDAMLSLSRDSESKKWDFVSVGRMNRFKNHHLLLPLAKHHRVAIVGDGPEREQLAIEARKTDAKGLSLLGHLAHSEALKVIAQSRVMVHPSAYDGFPRAMAEAIALGVPVVGDNAVIQYQINELGLGVLCPAEEQLAQAESLLYDTRRRERLSQSCRQFAAQHFGRESLEATAQVLLELANSNKKSRGKAGAVLKYHVRMSRARIGRLLRKEKSRRKLAD